MLVPKTKCYFKSSSFIFVALCQNYGRQICLAICMYYYLCFSFCKHTWIYEIKFKQTNKHSLPVYLLLLTLNLLYLISLDLDFSAQEKWNKRRMHEKERKSKKKCMHLCIVYLYSRKYRVAQNAKVNRR